MTVYFVGKGSGVLNIQSEVPERMLSSETYDILDAKLIFKNILSISSSANCTLTDGTYFIESLNNTYGFVYLSSTNSYSSSIYFEKGSIVEFEVTEITGSTIIRLDATGANDTIYTINSVGKYKFCYDGTTTKVYKDGELVNTANSTDESKNFRWRVNANSNMTFKGLLYY